MGKRPQTIPCAQPGCKRFTRLDGPGFCQSHNPAEANNRRLNGLRAVAVRKMRSTPDKKCAVEGCQAWHNKDTVYCSFHFRVHDPNSSQTSCQKENCRSLAPDASGYCFWHNPALEEARRQTLKKANKTRDLNKAPPEKACKIKGCKRWALEDGSGWCFYHQPAFRLERRNRMLGNKLARGHHLPWLGLKDINEARGLIFYSLIYDKPLLTLRALTKIASLHARGEVYIPAKHNTGDMDNRPSEIKQELSLPNSTDNTVILKQPML